MIANDDILMLIVRAFSEDQNQFAGTGYDGGAGYQGLPGTVYLRSGIYMLISTDKGNNQIASFFTGTIF